MPARGIDRGHQRMQTYDHARRRACTRKPNAAARLRPLVLMGDPGKMGSAILQEQKEVGKAPTGMIY